MSVGVLLDVAIVTVLGLGVLVGLSAAYAWWLDHRGPRPRPESGRWRRAASLPGLGVFLLFRLTDIFRATPSQRGTQVAATLLIVVVVATALLLRRDLHNRADDPWTRHRLTMPGVLAVMVVVAGLGGVAALDPALAPPFLGTLAAVVAGLLLIAGLAHLWVRIRPARFRPRREPELS